MEEDYYKMLGCERGATAEEIKKAFKEKAKKMHPDKGGDAEQFKKINEAHKVLSDPDLRSKYDQFGKNGLNGMDFSMHEFPDIFNMFSSSFRPMHQEKRTKDRIMDLEVSMEEAYTGVSVKFRFKRKIFVGDAANAKCSVCRGQGKIMERMSTHMGILQNIRMCSACAGIGTAIKEDQFRSQAEIIDVNVPPHCHYGYQFVISEKADEMPGIKTGNLILNLVIKKHPVFQLIHHYHLLWEIEVHPLEALTAFSRSVKLPSGEDISIHHKSGDAFFSKLEKWRVLHQKGMYNNERDRGHLFIKFRLKDFSFPASNAHLLYEMAGIKESPHHAVDIRSIPLCALDVHDTEHHHHHETSHHRGPQQPQVQECRPS